MGDGSQQNPLTREDVLRLRRELVKDIRYLLRDMGWMGIPGPLVLDFKHKHFQRGIDLRGETFKGRVWRGTRSLGWLAQFGGANLSYANLQKVQLQSADLRQVVLTGARLEGTNIEFAHLEGAQLGRSGWQGAIGLESVDWGDYVLGEEKARYYREAAAVYRELKIWHTQHGIYDQAGKFAFREAECRRKAVGWGCREFAATLWRIGESVAKRWVGWDWGFRARLARHTFGVVWRAFWNKLWLEAVGLLAGHGERPQNVVLSALFFVLAFTGFFFAAFAPQSGLDALWQALYFSLVSFAALGYGAWVGGEDSWVPQPPVWAQFLGVFETLLGVFMIALFLTLFVRKMAR